ncbi:hypothetical protein I601_0346 [Nocardioides dokdonensis FR1436]|uniref:Uncharacterized protein n=1 Tax=Nocardioides dokdonensis FR1436 TaxID=1300347 RepID=A0A1A9GEP4_9ACTN|nr:hypothetical protein [Nocardioides dokdonensis]ANH36799.1 hypothetical protein I601_0346 [Nocardioides dokdonensis FR1436]
MNEHLRSDEVGAALQREVSDLHDTPLTLGDVRGRARRIQRRRHGVRAAAAVTLAAVAVPAVLLLGGTDDRTDGVDPATPTPPGTSGTAVLHDGTVTLGDGRTVDLAIGDAAVSSLGVLSDGRMVLTTNTPEVVQVLSADGSEAATYPVELNTFAMGPTDDTAAWIAPDGRVQVLEAGIREPIGLQALPQRRRTFWTVDAVIGDECLMSGSGCRVLASDGDHTTTVVTMEGVADLEADEAFSVSDVSRDGGTWAVAFRPGRNEQFGCSGLYDVASDAVVARTCETSNLEFAPDGQHLLGTRGDNNMDGRVTVLDRDLTTVLTYQGVRDMVVSRSAWADAEALLLAVVGFEDQQWSLLRVPIDGSDPTTVMGPVDGGNPELESEFLPSM